MKLLVLFTLVYASYSSIAAAKLRMIADINWPTGESFKSTEIGGLSGLTLDKKSSHLFAVSDDKSLVNPARFYEFEVKLTEKAFELKPINVVLLTDALGKNYEKHALDLEGISISGDKILLSSEGSLNKDKPILPGLLEFNREGKFQTNLEIPEKFLPLKDSADGLFAKKHGARDNLVFEALSSTEDGKSLFMGMEESTYQDGNVSNPKVESKTRIIQYVNSKPVKEVLYTLDKVPNISVAGLTVGETGLVDLAMIDDKSGYSLERAFLPLARRTFIKIFKITNLDLATDISKYDSIKDVKDIKDVSKELELNLDDILTSLNEKNKTTDNIEGICFGPILPNGHKTLIVVSDNNFSKFQRTQFIAFEILE